jgi:hypothetical protein
MKTLNEALDYLDMKDQVEPKITVDEYAAKMGKDSDIVTVTFTVHSKLAAKDLVSWLERGYDFILDASISDGELEPGDWLVFTEMDRRIAVPDRIIKILSDLETLTGLDLDDWIVDIDGTEVGANEELIRDQMILNPNEYRMEKEKDEKLDEVRQLAGLDPEKTPYVEDEYIKNLKALARI